MKWQKYIVVPCQAKRGMPAKKSQKIKTKMPQINNSRSREATYTAGSDGFSEAPSTFYSSTGQKNRDGSQCLRHGQSRTYLWYFCRPKTQKIRTACSLPNKSIPFRHSASSVPSRKSLNLLRGQAKLDQESEENNKLAPKVCVSPKIFEAYEQAG